MKRKKCILCGSPKIDEIYKIENMPSFMGVVESNNVIIKNDMIVGECDQCGLIQNINLLDQDLVYMNNHNTEVVGETWQNHYVELCDFIKKNSVGDIILEIGDPTAKLAKNIKDNYKKWIIVEPNTTLESFENVEIIKKFFEGEKPTDDNITTIVHSHVLEHIYDPIKFLKDCNKIINDGDVTIFSIPNIKWLLENKALPTSILHFEHTYYVDDENIELFLNKSGFELNETKNYKNHSIFIKATKNSNIYNNNNIKRFDLKKSFLEIVQYYNNEIEMINDKLQDKEYYLYSAHINSQFMLNYNISKNIKGLLDKSTSKIDKKLYGYEYEIYNPNIIKNEEIPIVVASHMGVYYEEIKKDILSINKKTIII